MIKVIGLYQFSKLVAREGVIIEWPLFHDVRDVIITSQNDVRGMNDDDDDDDNEMSIFTIKQHYKSLKWRFLTFWVIKTVRSRDFNDMWRFCDSKLHNVAVGVAVG